MSPAHGRQRPSAAVRAPMPGPGRMMAGGPVEKSAEASRRRAQRLLGPPAPGAGTLLGIALALGSGQRHPAR